MQISVVFPRNNNQALWNEKIYGMWQERADGLVGVAYWFHCRGLQLVLIGQIKLPVANGLAERQRRDFRLPRQSSRRQEYLESRITMTGKQRD